MIIQDFPFQCPYRRNLLGILDASRAVDVLLCGRVVAVWPSMNVRKAFSKYLETGLEDEEGLTPKSKFYKVLSKNLGGLTQNPEPHLAQLYRIEIGMEEKSAIHNLKLRLQGACWQGVVGTETTSEAPGEILYNDRGLMLSSPLYASDCDLATL